MGPSAQAGLMREMSTELETRLQSRGGPRVTQSTSGVSKPPAPPRPLVPKPSVFGGIKFNERAEVMEVEKQKNETDRSVREILQ